MYFFNNQQKDVRDERTTKTSIDEIDRSVVLIRDDVTKMTPKQPLKDGPKQDKPRDEPKKKKPTEQKPHAEQCICEMCTCG